MARKQRFREEEEAAVDMTPMLDIVFIMLIFFIVTTSFVKEAGIEVNKPKAAQATNQKMLTFLLQFAATVQSGLINSKLMLNVFQQKSKVY